MFNNCVNEIGLFRCTTQTSPQFQNFRHLFEAHMLKQMIDWIWYGGTSPDDSEIYGIIHKELSSGQMDVGLWTKATAVSDGNTDKAKARYIEMRANTIRAERKRILEFAKEAQREQAKLEKQNAEMEKRYAELQELRLKESNIANQLWLNFESPDAKRAKRKKQLLFTLIYIVLSAAIYFLMTDKDGASLIIFFGFIFWILSLATYGKLGLEEELRNIRRRIHDLGGNV